MRIAYSGRSRPTAEGLAEEEGVELVRNSRTPVLVNWGRSQADAELNPDISKSTNKRVMRELFEEHGVPMPKLWTEAEVRRCIADQSSDMPYMWVGRPDRHTKGRGFWKVIGRGSLDRALRGTRKKKAATHFMEFIESDREYRVHIFKGKSIRISEKDFNSPRDKNDYTTRKPQHPIRRVRRAAKQAVEALGLDFGAVDILARGDNNEEVFVLEVNAAPGLGGSLPELYVETFKQYERGEW